MVDQDPYQQTRYRGPLNPAAPNAANLALRLEVFGPPVYLSPKLPIASESSTEDT